MSVVQTKSQFYNASGALISLSDEIARGGEGRIFNVNDHPDLVAKIYHRAIDQEKATKLLVLVSLKTDRLLNLTAWPVDTLHDFAGGPVSGFLMPRITDHKDIHILYGVKSRNAEFPEAAWPFLIQAAANVARAFNVIHEHGHVIGDVNHGSIVVSKKATVRLVDCDSFQITTPEHQFLCSVGISTHLPPELQGRDLRGIVRTANHDAFGLAIIIFQLLFMGRHPFSGTSLGPDDIPLEKAIMEHRFAYGRDSAYRQMRQPPASLSLDAVSPQIALMFEQAFLMDSNRPTAESWIEALTEMSTDLQKCAKDNSHYFINSLQACPWCKIESHSGIVLFQGGPGDTPAVPFDIVKTWMEILSVPAPFQDRLLKKSSIMTKSIAAQATSIIRRQHFKSAGFLFLLIIVMVIAQSVPLSPWPCILIFILIPMKGVEFMGKAASLAKDRLTQLKILAELQLTDARKLQKGHGRSDPFSKALRDLTIKREQLEKLSDLRSRKIDQLQKALQDHQLHDFLSAHRIEDANLHEIASTEIAILAAWGIEDAQDISKLSAHTVPGLKSSQINALDKWRKSLRDSFRDQRKWNVSQADLASVESEISSAKIKLQKELRSGVEYLRQLSQEIRASNGSGHPALKDCLDAYLQAQEYLKEISPQFWVRMTVGISVLNFIVFIVRRVLVP